MNLHENWKVIPDHENCAMTLTEMLSLRARSNPRNLSVSTVLRWRAELSGEFLRGDVLRKITRPSRLWSLEKRKCFILDVANSRVDLRKLEIPCLSESWKTSLLRSDLRSVVIDQLGPQETNCGYDEYELLDLGIFTSNLVVYLDSPFQGSPEEGTEHG